MLDKLGKDNSYGFCWLFYFISFPTLFEVKEKMFFFIGKAERCILEIHLQLKYLISN